ncbi:hypothetical protein ACE1OE_02140 [Vibrio sp. E150_011]
MNIFKVSLLASLIGLSSSAFAAETIVESFSGENMVVGATVDSDSVVTNIVSDSYSSDGDDRSWQISFTSSYQGNTIWGEWDWSNEETFKIDVLNDTGSEQQVTIKLIAMNTDWTDSYNLYGGATLASSDQAQTVEIDLNSATAGENFSKTGVGGIQVMLGTDPGSTVDVYFDNIRVDDGKDEPVEPAPEEVVVESFAEYTIGDIVDSGAPSPSNLVSGDYSTDGDGQSWHIVFDDALQGTTLWGDWSWSDQDTFKVDAINTSDQALNVTVKLISKDTDWTESYNLYGYGTLATGTDIQTIDIDLNSDSAGPDFTKAAVGGIQLMLTDAPASEVSIYFDNIRVAELEDGTIPPNPGNPDPDYPEIIGEGGSFGSFGLLIVSALALLRRRK